MSYKTLSLEIENRVATITINRPKMMNAFNEQLVWDMGDATEQVKNDSAIRVLVITGEGRGFSAGADLTEREVVLVRYQGCFIKRLSSVFEEYN